MTELAFLGKEYILSFDLLLNTVELSGYQSILHLTIGGDHAMYGDRTPGVWLNSNWFHIASAINGNSNKYKDISPQLQAGNWMQFEISQTLMNSTV